MYKKLLFGIKVTDQSSAKGVAFGNVKGILYPGLRIGQNCLFSVNFGEESFVYDITAHDWVAEESRAADAAKNIE